MHKTMTEYIYSSIQTMASLLGQYAFGVLVYSSGV